MKNLLNLTLFLAIFSFAFGQNSAKKTIVLDPGHGGQDKGVVYQDFNEQAYTLEIAQKILAQNKRPDIEFIILRENDQWINLGMRVEKINEIQPDLVLSLHLNKATNENLNGYECFVSKENSQFETSKELAEKLIGNFSNLPLNNRGVKEASFKILKESQVPAVLLEMGFLSSETDRNFLNTEVGKDQIVQNILAFLDSI